MIEYLCGLLLLVIIIFVVAACIRAIIEIYMKAGRIMKYWNNWQREKGRADKLQKQIEKLEFQLREAINSGQRFPNDNCS